eukprot:TRINITY_DN8057_c0_g1_i1.p1 TRINITY_DN8057_c0_g1~~TRINITY_DN8057_c0_g1_i1.p1  ORF type:complete len:231 (+),score=25.54 TRINITY_DN8057_c0_g1_i1:54-746(+)
MTDSSDLSQRHVPTRVRVAGIRQAKALTAIRRERQMIWNGLENYKPISERAVAKRTKKGIKLCIDCTDLGGMYDSFGRIDFNVEFTLKRFSVPSVRCCSHHLLHPCVDESGFVRGMFVSAGTTEKVLSSIGNYILEFISAPPSTWSSSSCLSHSAMRVLTKCDISVPDAVVAYAGLTLYSPSIHKSLPFSVRRSIATILAAFAQRHEEFICADLAIEVISFIPWKESLRK